MPTTQALIAAAAKFERMGYRIDSGILLDLIHQDASGQGVACGNSFIAKGKKCSKDKAKTTPKEALRRTTAKQKDRQKLRAEVERRPPKQISKKKIEIDNLKASKAELEAMLALGRDQDGDRITQKNAESMNRQLRQINKKLRESGANPGADIDFASFKPLANDTLMGTEKQVEWAMSLRQSTYNSTMNRVNDLKRQGIEGVSNVDDGDIDEIQRIATDMIASKKTASYWIDTRYSPETSKFANEAARRHFENLAEEGDPRIDPVLRDRLSDFKRDRLEREQKAKSREQRFKDLETPELDGVSAKQIDYATTQREKALQKALDQGVDPDDLGLLLSRYKSASWWLDTGRHNVKGEIEKLKKSIKL